MTRYTLPTMIVAGEQRRSTGAAAISSALLVLLLVAHISGVAAGAAREPHIDETEYLHAGWLMANGSRLYVDFFEHHPPFTFKALAQLAPHGELTDVEPYFVRARLLSGFFGFIALAALAAMLWPAATEAAPIAVALLIASGPLWLRAFADVRPDVFALGFLLSGAALVVRRRDIWCGIGAGLAVMSVLWSPKWPLVAMTIVMFGLARADRRAKAIGAAAVTSFIGFAAIRAIVPFDAWWYFNFDVNVALARALRASSTSMSAHFAGGVPFLHVPPVFHPMYVLPASIVVAAAFFFARDAVRGFVLAMLVASAVELRFVHPWPAIWLHYYAAWAIASAGVIALVPSSLALLIHRSKFIHRAKLVRLAIATALLVTSGAHVIAIVAPVSSDAVFWTSGRNLRARMRRGDVVWLERGRHPVSVRDASYYWFSMPQIVEVARELRRTPRGARFLPEPEPFPTCMPSGRLRFTLDPGPELEPATTCLQRLLASGSATPTIFSGVYEVRLATLSDNRSARKGIE